MGNDPLTTVPLRGARVTFMLGDADDAETVENVDVLVTLDDGSRWSATLLTLAEIQRLMDRRTTTGESFGGAYFQCPDLIILRHGGVPAATALLQQLVDAGEVRYTLVRAEDED